MSNSTNNTQPDHMITDQSHHDGNAQHGGHEEGIPKDLPEVSTGKVLLAVAVFCALLFAMFLIGYIPSHREEQALKKETAENADAKPIVNVTRPKRQDTGDNLVLPGNVEALQMTSIYPRANGYMSELNVDIGDKVKKDQILAVISTPEVDAQLAQSRAAEQQAQANIAKAQNDHDLAKTTYERYQSFGKTGGVTQQEVDQRQNSYTQAKSDLEAAKAALASAKANVQQLEATQGFQQVKAPFDGTITARNFDLGALLSSTSTRPMFTIAQTDTLRVFVNVPQTYATLVKIGQDAKLFVSNYPSQPFIGKVTRTASALDPVTRTIRTEVDFPNKEGLLYAGMYSQIKFELRPPNPPLIVATSSLIYNAKGLRVATVNASDDKVHFIDIAVGRDFGTELEVASGLKGDELVITNPGERITEGGEVQLSEQSKQLVAATPATKPAVADAK